jgi:hypothetical protein
VEGLSQKTRSDDRGDSAVVQNWHTDFPECIDDFGMLWFEDEYVISEAANWVLAANVADAIVR